MGRIEFEHYVSDVIRQQPHPPRQYDRRWLRHLIVDRGAGALYLMGILGGFVAVANWLRLGQSITSVEEGLFVWGVAFIALVVGLGPFYGAWERHYAIMVGRLGWARVTQVRRTTSGVRVVWEVQVDGQRFTEPSLLGQHWAPDLVVGMTVRVLVHPRRLSVLMGVGP